MKIAHFKTNRGFTTLEFEDYYKQGSSLQESSLAEISALWFGIDGKRMHLTQEQVQQLLPYLQHFAEHGELPEPPQHETENSDG